MSDDNSAGKVRRSRAFSRARKKAETLLANRQQLNQLAADAGEKMQRRIGALGEIRQSLLAFLRLIKAWAAGRYRSIPWNSLLLIVASVVYFVMPFDVVPDFLVALGLVDDLALLAWVARQCKKDIDAFLAWEEQNQKEKVL
ncbi:MAG TPA: DUF1232 domain-containing protein [Pseudomonadales bacterium]